MRANEELTIKGRRLRLSNLDKVLYPSVRFTKADVIDYYLRVAPVLLAHLRDRALTLKRYPEGVEGGHFYQRMCPEERPDWVRTAPVWSERRQAAVDCCVVDDLPTLVWAANLADLELHTGLSKVSHPERPTAMVFDLDPGTPADIISCGRVALLVRAVLNGLGLEAFAKTSGAKGMQVYVPLNTPRASYDRTKSFAHALAELLEREHPERVVSRMSKALRPGKVFVDWSQNDPRKTTVCAYSLRARERPTVSTPVSWEEISLAVRHGSPRQLSFEADAALSRTRRFGDLFAPVLTLRQTLPRRH